MKNTTKSAARKPRPRLTVAYYASQDGQGGSSHYSVKDGTQTIARVGAGKVATDTDETWAQLFAAAPDLLEACRTLLICSPDLRQGFPLWIDMEAGLINFKRSLKAAHRAICKAEPREA